MDILGLCEQPCSRQAAVWISLTLEYSTCIVKRAAHEHHTNCFPFFPQRFIMNPLHLFLLPGYGAVHREKRLAHAARHKAFIWMLLFVPIMNCARNLSRLNANELQATGVIIFSAHAILLSLFWIFINQPYFITGDQSACRALYLLRKS